MVDVDEFLFWKEQRMRRYWIVSVALVVAAGLAVTVPGAAQARTRPFTRVWYGPEHLQTVDVYPASSPGSPLVVLVHGGAWRSDDHAWNGKEALALRAAGDAVFVVNYRSDSPTQPAFPMEVNDVIAGTEWSIHHGETYDADPRKVVYVAGSAGSTLASLAVEKLNSAEHRTIRAVVTLSGAMDFTMLDPLDAEQAQAVGCRSTACPIAKEQADGPAGHLTPHNCPADWLTINGTHERTPLSQALAMYDALRDARCRATFVQHPGHAHAWQYWDAEFSTIVSFINSSMRGS